MPDAVLLYTPEAAAEKLSMGRTTIYGKMASGEIESVKIGRSRRISNDALRRYVDRISVSAGGSD
jgi:excisionase family DNA binding protein